MSKFKFSFADNTFTIPAKDVKRTGWNGKPVDPKIVAEPSIAGKLIKQFVKANYLGVVCSVKSSWFSMGNSLNVWISHADGSKVDVEVFKSIEKFANQFQEGKYNSYDEMYEHSDREFATDCGIPIIHNTKWVMVENNAKFGSVEYAINVFNEEGRVECDWVLNRASYSDAKRRRVENYIANK
jgi:hypothetical protein